MTIKGYARVFDDRMKQSFDFSLFVYETEAEALAKEEKHTSRADKVGYLGIVPVTIEVPDKV